MNNCGISRWDDPNAINEQLRKLTDAPIYEVSESYYTNEVMNYFDKKCTRSRAVYEEAKEFIPAACSITSRSTSRFRSASPARTAHI